MEEAINQELYVKYVSKYKQEKLALLQELNKFQNQSSNLENDADVALGVAENISKIWASAEYKDKQRLQYHLFPDGIYYDRKNDAVRTENINPLFLWMAQQVQVLSNKKSGIPELNLSYAALVAGE